VSLNAEGRGRERLRPNRSIPAIRGRRVPPNEPLQAAAAPEEPGVRSITESRVINEPMNRSFRLGHLGGFRCFPGSAGKPCSDLMKNEALARGMYFVPSGQHDRSLARSAWKSVPHRGNRPGGYGMIGVAKPRGFSPQEVCCDARYFVFGNSLLPIKWVRTRIRPYPTGQLFRRRFPGTSCQATIAPSLGD
jgi:hypothetical protein